MDRSKYVAYSYDELGEGSSMEDCLMVYPSVLTRTEAFQKAMDTKTKYRCVIECNKWCLLSEKVKEDIWIFFKEDMTYTILQRNKNN